MNCDDDKGMQNLSTIFTTAAFCSYGVNIYFYWFFIYAQDESIQSEKVDNFSVNYLTKTKNKNKKKQMGIKKFP